MKTTNIMQCISNQLQPLALAGAVLCLATSAQAGQIPVDHPFKPAGVPVGGTFHWVFVTPTGIAATSTDIAVYNAHVQSAATSAGIGRWTWKAIASTRTVIANVNAPVSADVYLTRTGVLPMVATAANFYSTTNHLVQMNYNPAGTAHVEVPESPHAYDASPTWAVWTGSNRMGTIDTFAMGDTGGTTCYGYADNTGQYWARWEHDGARTDQTKLLPLYGLSEALTVVDETANSNVSGDWHTPATWDPVAVPSWVTKVIVNNSAHAVTISSTPAADCYSLTVSSGSVSSTGGTLNVASTEAGALNTGGGTLALDATSTLNIAKANTSASLVNLAVGSGTILNITGELTVDASKVLTGATLNTPKLTLAGIGNTLTIGAVTVPSGGLISGTGTVAGLVTVAGGGKATPGTSIGSFTVSGLTLDAGSLLTMEATNTTTPDQITVSDTNGLTINGGAVTFLNGTGTAPQTTLGAYPLIAYSGTIQGTGVSALTVANPVAGLRYSFAESGGYVTLTVAQGALWSGADGGLWGNPANWSGVTPLSTETLVYAASGSSGSSVNDLSGASFQSIQFNSGVNAFTLSGTSVTLTGDINGAVVVNNSSNIQTVNLPIVLGNNGAIDAASNTVVFGSAGTIDNAGFSLTVKGAQAATLNGVITNSGGLTKSGLGTLTLSGTNIHTGGVTLSAGTLNINSTTALGATAGAFTISGGTIDNTTAGALVNANNNPQNWNDDFTFTGTQDLNLGIGAVTITKNGDYRVFVSGGASKTLTIGGAITMAGANSRLVKRNNGTLVISSAGSNIQRLQVTGGGNAAAG